MVALLFFNKIGKLTFWTPLVGSYASSLLIYICGSAKINIKTYHLSSRLPPLQGEMDIYPNGLFCPKFDAKKVLFETFFGIMHIFGSVSPKMNAIFPFLCNLIFRPYHLSSPLAPLRGEIDIYPKGLFCPKSDTEKLLFEAFFGIMRIFGSVQPKSECNFSFLYI